VQTSTTERSGGRDFPFGKRFCCRSVRELRQKLGQKAKQPKAISLLQSLRTGVSRDVLEALGRQSGATTRAGGLEGVSIEQIAAKRKARRRFLERNSSGACGNGLIALRGARVYILKPNGKLRPLASDVRDRVVSSVLLILEPIFEADF